MLLSGDAALAQTPDAKASSVTPIVANVTRAEAWSFFEPPQGAGDPDYLLVSNRATLGAIVDGGRFSVRGSFQYAQLLGLPRQAVPHALGPGAFFFAAAGATEAYQLYFRSLSLRVNAPHGLSIEGGRMRYASGEGTPFAGRLVGGAEWTIFERAFDGVRVDLTRTAWRAHASFVMPTQGAFEESANPTMTRVQVGSAAWSSGALQLFGHQYRDTRRVAARPDNTGRAASAIDVSIQTFGASWGRSDAVGSDRSIDADVGRARQAGADDEEGRFELRLWGAWQRGRWYGQPHRAWSGIAEAEYARRDAGWVPAITAGVLYASGDDDALDGEHRTFFPMVPTTRPSLLAGTYAQMNLRDVYIRVDARPRQSLVLGGAAHWLSLATPRDRWYSGTGATALRGDYFGYSTRGSRLATGLGTYVELSVSSRVNRYWQVGASLGTQRAGAVIARQHTGRWLTVLALESRIAFPR